MRHHRSYPVVTESLEDSALTSGHQMDKEECSKELTETDELGALVQYPDDGTDATDHLRPSALQQNTTKHQSAPVVAFQGNMSCMME